jgi:hypothetical protein
MRILRTHLALILGMIICSSNNAQAQVVYVPVHHPVYDYLERLSIESIIDWDGTVVPVSRREVAKMLLHAGMHKERLTKVEWDELEYQKKNFRQELLMLGDSSANPGERWHLFSYRDSSFSVDLDPVLGETIGDGRMHFFNGAAFSGYAGSGIGYGFHFNDNQEKGKNIDREKKFVPETGINVIKSSGSDEIEYSETRAFVSYGSEHLQLSLGKYFMEWGSGNRGKLILSDKAPSFPMFRMDYAPVSWLNFHYMHGWLQSLVIDSLRSYETQLPHTPRNVYREKYIAAHIVSLRPFAGLVLSVGESIVYSDGSPNVLFLIPVIFFRAADHYLTHYSQNDGGNSQFFFDAKYDFQRHVRTYGTLFVDEIVPGAVFDSQRSRNQLGYTLGTRIINPIVENVDATIEYTRILPWVYSNSNQSQLYENSGYLLGHYIGQNADQLFLNLRWRPVRGLLVSGYFDYARRGGKAGVEKQYELPSLPFLYGNVERTTIKGASIQYEYFHDLVGKCDFYWRNPYISSGSFQIEATVEYGLPVR